MKYDKGIKELIKYLEKEDYYNKGVKKHTEKVLDYVIYFCQE